MKKQMAILLAALGFGLFTCKDKPLEPERINSQDPEYIGPKMTELVAPKNDTTVDTRQLKFMWKATTNADRYQFQAGTSSNFDAPAANAIKIDTTVAKNSFSAERRFEPPAIFWRVRGINVASGATLTGAWTAPFKVNLIKPQIKVEPDSFKTQINFGTRCRNAEYDQNITLTNVGEGELNFESVVLGTAAKDTFLINSGGGKRQLDKNKSQLIIVRFKPLSGGNKTADLQITTNDLDKKEIKIALKGTGNDPQLQTTPPPGQDGFVDFGEANVNDPVDAKAVKFTLTNMGSAEFKIRNIIIRRSDGMSSDHFAFAERPELPFFLSPMLPKTVTVLFAPTDANNNNDKTAILKIEGDCGLMKEIKLKGKRKPARQ